MQNILKPMARNEHLEQCTVSGHVYSKTNGGYWHLKKQNVAKKTSLAFMCLSKCAHSYNDDMMHDSELQNNMEEGGVLCCTKIL